MVFFYVYEVSYRSLKLLIIQIATQRSSQLR